MNKILILTITPLISILLVIIQFPDVQRHLDSDYKDWTIYIELIIVILTIVLYTITVVIPFLINEKLATKRWNLITEATNEIDGLFKQYELSYNIVIPKYQFLNNLEPISNGSRNTKWSFNTKVFKLIWEGKKSSMPKGMKFTINQGTCGSAYQSKESHMHQAIYTKKNLKKYNFNFSERQNELTNDLRFIVSVAIIENITDAKGNSKKVQGVLNVHSKKLNSERILFNDPEKSIFEEKIFRLVNIVKDLI